MIVHNNFIFVDVLFLSWLPMVYHCQIMIIYWRTCLFIMMVSFTIADHWLLILILIMRWCLAMLIVIALLLLTHLDDDANYHDYWSLLMVSLAHVHGPKLPAHADKFHCTSK